MNRKLSVFANISSIDVWIKCVSTACTNDLSLLLKKIVIDVIVLKVDSWFRNIVVCSLTNSIVRFKAICVLLSSSTNLNCPSWRCSTWAWWISSDWSIFLREFVNAFTSFFKFDIRIMLAVEIPMAAVPIPIEMISEIKRFGRFFACFVLDLFTIVHFFAYTFFLIYSEHLSSSFFGYCFAHIKEFFSLMTLESNNKYLLPLE